MRHTTRLWALAITGVLTLAACGGGGSGTPTAQSARASTTVAATVTSTSSAPLTTPTTVAAAVTTTPPTAAAPAVFKVAANTGSQAEIAAAFTAAGISNPANWAKEVVEYRPYPTNDPTFAELRQNLVKCSSSPGTPWGLWPSPSCCSSPGPDVGPWSRCGCWPWPSS